MINHLDPDMLEDLMMRYVLHDLSRAETDEFERLLKGNPELAAEVSSLQKTLHLMSYATATEPPPHLRARVLQAARAATNRKAAHTLPQRLPWSKLVGTVAALLAIVLAWDSYRLRQELQLQKEVTTLLQQPNVLLSFSLAGTERLGKAVGNVVLDLDAKKAAVVIRGLPPLPADQVYRLWALLRKGEKVPCGQFNANSQGVVFSQLMIPVDAYTSPVVQLILTRELASSPLYPVGPTVMVSS